MKAEELELIPITEIDPLARDIAVLWVEGFEKIGGMMLIGKHKLASDIMNYGKQKAVEFTEWLTDNFYTVDSNFLWYDCRKATPEIVLYKTTELYELFIKSQKK